MMETKTCVHCGDYFDSNNKIKKYCSNKCCNTHYNKKRHNTYKVFFKNCHNCNELFTHRDPQTKYCDFCRGLKKYNSRHRSYHRVSFRECKQCRELITIKPGREHQFVCTKCNEPFKPINCIDCGLEIIPKASAQKRCNNCQLKERRKQHRDYEAKKRGGYKNWDDRCCKLCGDKFNLKMFNQIYCGKCVTINKRYSDNLTDTYIIGIMTNHKSNLTYSDIKKRPELIKAKRELINIRREILNLNKK